MEVADVCVGIMSGWTTIWMAIVAVGAGTGTWYGTPKGPNQVCVSIVEIP